MPRPPADLPAILLARAYLTSGVPLTLLLDLAAGSDLDSAEILAVEQATALARRENARAAGERSAAFPDKGKYGIA